MNSAADPIVARRNSMPPKYSRFVQQELPSCTPILTPLRVIFISLLVAIVSVAFGVVSLSASRSVVEIIYRYDTECIPADAQKDKVAFIQSNRDKSCNLTLTVPKQMQKPIFVYYQLDNFLQYQRRYRKSRSDQQLKDPKYADETTSCKPEDMAHGDPVVPCGLIAWSLFNDTYSFSTGNMSLAVDKKGISWKSDREKKFGKDVYPHNFQSNALIGGASLDTSVPLSEQEDLIVWMRTAAFPTFRKLYGKIDVSLGKGQIIHVELKNNYNTFSFHGKKKLVLSTTNWIGGKNDSLGIAYLTVGGLCLCYAAVFGLMYLFKPRRLGDPAYLSWTGNRGGHQ